jgi:hemerythrin
MYEMKDEYRLGILEIDNEHEKLFEIADRLYNLINFEFIPDKYDYIMTVIEELKDYTEEHFAHEEEYMEKIGYKKMFSQKIDHHNFIEKIKEFTPTVIDANQADVCKELLSFITEWLVSHILEKDMDIAKN